MSKPLDSYWNFFTTFNTRNPQTFSSALRYPHVRISPRRTPVVVPTLEAHAQRQTWQPFIDTGWDHTVGMKPIVLHESEDRAHIVGGWTRFTADEKPILTNHVCYIVTNTAEGWGVQSRFGVDGDASEENYAVAVDLVDRYFDALVARQWRTAAASCRYPTFRIGVGEIGRWETAPGIRN